MDILNGFYNLNKKSIADPYGNSVQRFDKLATYVDMAVKGLGDNTVSAIQVAKALYKIKQEELYKDYPVPNTDNTQRFHEFDAFAQTMFSAKKSTIANYLALYERFGADSPLRVKDIPPKFEDKYSYTQLLLMLPLSASELLTIKPSMSCSEIKKYVKSQKEKNIVNSNQLENSQENTKAVEEAEDIRYKSYKLDTVENCQKFLLSYERWEKIVEFNIYKSIVRFYQIKLRNFTVVAYTSDYSGMYPCTVVFKALFYIFNHTDNYFAGVHDRFSVFDKLNIEGASALLSSLPVEFAEVRV
ncbi:MAG: hypothetical protein K2L70_04475 [Clostridia bacterium]|nr:hypothetical protein [Clostridia bacterium]